MEDLACCRQAVAENNLVAGARPQGTSDEIADISRRMHDRAHQKTPESCKGRRNAGEAVIGRALFARCLRQSEGYGARLPSSQNGDLAGIARRGWSGSSAHSAETSQGGQCRGLALG